MAFDPKDRVLFVSAIAHGFDVKKTMEKLSTIPGKEGYACDGELHAYLTDLSARMRNATLCPFCEFHAMISHTCGTCGTLVGACEMCRKKLRCTCEKDMQKAEQVVDRVALMKERFKNRNPI